MRGGVAMRAGEVTRGVINLDFDSLSRTFVII